MNKLAFTKIDFYDTDTTFNKSELINCLKLYILLKKRAYYLRKLKTTYNRKKMIENDQLDCQWRTSRICYIN